MTDENTPVEGLPVEEGGPEAEPTPHDLGLDLPADPAEAQAMLLRLLAESREEATSYLGDLKRVAADFDNFRKRTMREQSQTLDRATERVVERLLPALDSLDAALAIETDTDSGKKLLAGMENTRQQILTALGEEGLTVISTVGEKFDPAVHEPIGAPAGQGELVVSEILRRGYAVNGRLIRAALVTLETNEA